jgi:hypothetical protein
MLLSAATIAAKMFPFRTENELLAFYVSATTDEAGTKLFQKQKRQPANWVQRIQSSPRIYFKTFENKPVMQCRT